MRSFKNMSNVKHLQNLIKTDLFMNNKRFEIKTLHKKLFVNIFIF